MLEKSAPSLRQAAALAACWTVLVGPAYFLVGTTAVEGLSYAALLCVLPSGLSFARGAVGRGENPVVDLVLAMGLRVALVLAGAWLIQTVRPEMTAPTFLYWLIPLYCVALIMETQQALKAESVCGSVTQSAHSG